MGFEPTIKAGERPQTYALDRKATGTGKNKQIITYNSWIIYGVGVSVSNLDMSVNIRVKTASEIRSTFCRQNVFNGVYPAKSKRFISLKLAIKLHVFKEPRE